MVDRWPRSASLESVGLGLGGSINSSRDDIEDTGSRMSPEDIHALLNSGPISLVGSMDSRSHSMSVIADYSDDPVAHTDHMTVTEIMRPKPRQRTTSALSREANSALDSHAPLLLGNTDLDPDNASVAVTVNDADDGASRHSVDVFSMPDKRFLVAFPRRLERLFHSFDQAIIYICQKPRGPFFTYLSLFITLFTTIEVCIPVPFIMYIAGWDGLATVFTYFALMACLISQVPKRFIWRFRPYMVGRAERRRLDKTSSFPSRAVTCAMVYSFAVCWTYNYRMEYGTTVLWWQPILIIGWTLLASFARINLGVHYPSDCVFGALQGALISALAATIWAVNTVGCSTCREFDCYSTGDNKIAYDTLGKVNWWFAAIIVLILTIVVIISMVRPLEFWNKCDRVYGTLLPCILFQITFLCPSSLNNDSSLPVPDKGTWYSYLYGGCFAIIFTAVPILTKGKWSFVVWAILFIATFCALSWWRLFFAN